MSFTDRTTAQEVAEAFPSAVEGKYVLITGGYGGLGKETARILCFQGANVIVCGRSTKSLEETVVSIKKEGSDLGKASIFIESLVCDLNKLSSVKQCAEEYLEKYPKLDILINNAGIMASPLSFTFDKIESQFGVNHVAHHYLTKLLLDKLIDSSIENVKEGKETNSLSRVINLASIAHYIFPNNDGIRFDDINGEKYYEAWERYGASKLANLLDMKAFTKRYSATLVKNPLPSFDPASRLDKVLFLTVHPGVINSTGLGRHLSGLGFRSVLSFLFWNRGRFTCLFKKTESKSIPQGASTTVYAAMCNETNLRSGGYYYDNAQKMSSDDLYNHPLAENEKLTDTLWEFSEKMIADKIG